MATTDISALVRDALAATDRIARATPPGRTRSGRTCAELADELSTGIAGVEAAVAQAEAFIDMAASAPLCEDLSDAAGLAAGALLLGGRLFDSNADEIVELHPALSPDLEPVTAVAELLSALSDRVRRTVVHDQVTDPAAA